MQDSEKRIIFRFVSAIQIASKVIFSPEESIKIILTHNIMKLNEEETYNAHLWLLTVPRVGIVEFASLLIPKEYYRTNHRMTIFLTSPWA